MLTSHWEVYLSSVWLYFRYCLNLEIDVFLYIAVEICVDCQEVKVERNSLRLS
jgi:hypothetical protein